MLKALAIVGKMNFCGVAGGIGETGAGAGARSFGWRKRSSSSARVAAAKSESTGCKSGCSDYPGGHPEGFSDAHKMHYRAVYEHIASGRKTPAWFAGAEDGHHEVKLCEAILRSDDTRQWTAV